MNQLGEPFNKQASTYLHNSAVTYDTLIRAFVKNLWRYNGYGGAAKFAKHVYMQTTWLFR